jgi:hypothetical protein
MKRETALILILCIYILIILYAITSLILLENNTSISNEIIKLIIKDCWWCK